MAEQTTNHGGKRPNAGRKAGKDGRTASISVTVPLTIISKVNDQAHAKGLNLSQATTEAYRRWLGEADEG